MTVISQHVRANIIPSKPIITGLITTKCNNQYLPTSGSSPRSYIMSINADRKLTWRRYRAQRSLESG